MTDGIQTFSTTGVLQSNTSNSNVATGTISAGMLAGNGATAGAARINPPLKLDSTVDIRPGALNYAVPPVPQPQLVAVTTQTPGYKTTEFWGVFGTAAVVMLNNSGLLGTYQVDPAIAYSVMGLAIAYLASRFGLKASGSGTSQLSSLLQQLQALQTK